MTKIISQYTVNFGDCDGAVEHVRNGGIVILKTEMGSCQCGDFTTVFDGRGVVTIITGDDVQTGYGHGAAVRKFTDAL